MGFYSRRILPRIQDKALDNEEIRAIRARVCAPLRGEVVEIGFGSGLNVAHYPAAVTLVHAIEPSDLARKLAAPRVAGAPVPITFDGLDGQRLPLDDESVDTAAVTFTLCTVPDPDLAARELYRVLRPGGIVAFVEHGASPDPAVRKWQGRLNPLNRHLSGCRLDTATPQVFRRAGFELADERQYYLRGPIRSPACLHEGTAHKIRPGARSR